MVGEADGWMARKANSTCAQRAGNRHHHTCTNHHAPCIMHRMQASLPLPSIIICSAAQQTRPYSSRCLLEHNTRILLQPFQPQRGPETGSLANFHAPTTRLQNCTPSVVATQRKLFAGCAQAQGLSVRAGATLAMRAKDAPRGVEPAACSHAGTRCVRNGSAARAWVSEAPEGRGRPTGQTVMVDGCRVDRQGRSRMRRGAQVNA